MLPEGSPKLGAVQGAMDELFVPEATESGSRADTRPADGLRSFRGICGGVLDDARRRSRHCGADYTTGVRSWQLTLSAACFMFLATFFSTVALGAHVQDVTANRIGLSEYLLMNSIAGIFHSLVGAQPLLVLRPTGPITAILQKLSELADALELNFFALLAAVGLFVGLLLGVAASLELSRHIRRLTRFTHDVFACFVCSIYVYEGISSMAKRFSDDHSALDGSRGSDFGDALFGCICTVATVKMALVLSGAERWGALPPRVAEFLARYAVTIAVLAVTLISLWAPAADGVERILLFEKGSFGPTCYLDPSYLDPTRDASSIGPSSLDASSLDPSSIGPSSIDTIIRNAPATPVCVDGEHAAYGETSRAWFVYAMGEGTWSSSTPLLLGVAALVSFPISFFFYLDQNISSLLCQQKQLNLSRGHYYHGSLMAIAALNVFGPALGLPFVTGSLPHSPQFVKALTNLDGTVAENRVAPLICNLLLGLSLLLPAAIELLPNSATNGVLIFVGIEGLISTDLWRRTLLLCAPPSLWEPQLREVRMRAFTLIQLGALAVCWAINLSPAGLCVAIFIIALVPLRRYLMPRIFSVHDLALLDPE